MTCIACATPGKYETVADAKKDLDHLTDLLCTLTKRVPSEFLTDPAIIAWIEHHKIEDAERERATIAANDPPELSR